MAGIRRRRRQRNIWLPVVGSQHQANDTPSNWSTDEYGSVPVSNAFDWRGEIVPLTVDHNLRPAEFTTDTTMAEVMGNEWILRRIVGNIVCWHETGVHGTLSGTYSANAQVIAGFFVARTSVNQADDAVPIGVTTAVTNFTGSEANYNPGNPANIREPWIWRRRWILGIRTGNGNTVGETSLVLDSGAPVLGSTQNFNVREAGSIDAKTIRRIRTDERLFFVIAVQMFYPVFNGTLPTNNSVIHWTLDYRLLGGLRRARQKGAF